MRVRPRTQNERGSLGKPRILWQSKRKMMPRASRVKEMAPLRPHW